MIKRKIFKILIANLFLLVAAPSIAADFTFHVPVNFKNLHQDLVHIDIICRLFDNNSNHTLYGVNQTRLDPPPNGNLSTTATVAVNVNQGKDPSEVGYYSCYFRVVDAAGVQSAAGSGSQVPIWKRFKDGTTTVEGVQGNIPQ